MGTRSVIGVMHGDKAKTVYCHWDGYLEHNGRILQECYDSAKANNLVALGDLSTLGHEVVAPEGVEHSYDDPAENICVFYGRDRKETNVDFQVCFSDAEMFDKYDGCEYFYIMKDGVWSVSEGPGTEWKVLNDALRELDEPDFKAPKITVLILPMEETND